jgi:hypothetical protein
MPGSRKKISADAAPELVQLQSLTELIGGAGILPA